MTVEEVRPGANLVALVFGLRAPEAVCAAGRPIDASPLGLDAYTEEELRREVWLTEHLSPHVTWSGVLKHWSRVGSTGRSAMPSGPPVSTVLF